jgi:hypothetical protein
MIKKIVKFSFIAIAIFFFSCTSQKSKEISFKEAQNYFVKNTFKTEQIISKKITSQSELNNFFGNATVMGRNGKPTVIDFEKEFVVVVICPETYLSSQLTSIKLVEVEKSKVNIKYKIINKEKQDYSVVPFSLMIVGKEHVDKHFVLKQY